MITVSILDDHTMVLKGLETMLEDSLLIKIIATYSKGKELLEDLNNTAPNVLLLDINLPDSNGIELCRTISKKYPDVSILGLSNYNETGFIKNMMRNGAKGYLLKNTSKDELIEAIKAVHNGETYLPSVLKNKLLNESIGIQSSYFIPKLTRREKEVLQLISKEHTTEEISKKLFITIKTVEAHRSNLIQKLGVRNTAGLIRVAFEKGLLL
ncbi:response regulator transcription factor [Aquimarina sp. 2201CG5-10]|uniref:response regulator transcription factor n=1 Tax=Aquimarina callyspongiae TaxID=3098150 RepID=UPI002AB51027|nr:response regulator transcription factor [Aquimarina sp. 2201CG5-10]MDY8137622.1 response regulator transcription factor [Aquimarina sp. 2201CG5-10]